MALVTNHSVQKTWGEGSRGMSEKEQLGRDFSLREDYLPTWFVCGEEKLMVNKLIFPLSFAWFSPQIFHPLHTHTSHPHMCPDGWSWSSCLPGSFPPISLSNHRWSSGPGSVSAHPSTLKSWIRCSVSALIDGSMLALWIHFSPLFLLSSRLAFSSPRECMTHAPCSVYSPLLGPFLWNRCFPGLPTFHPLLHSSIPLRKVSSVLRNKLKAYAYF
jgi:hypothetical protein